MERRVRGSLFADYVRMIRGRKDVDWSRHLREAATWQAVGFFEQLVTRAGAERVSAELGDKSWESDPRTTIELCWSM